MQFTFFYIDNTVRVAGGDEAVFQQEALVVMRTVVDESLLMTLDSREASDLIASCGPIKTRFYLREERF